jgi:DNA-directed RNA polymerase specialized sigma24 family protein
MHESESVTQWIAEIKAGGQGVDAAQQELWSRYFDRLVALARARLVGAPRGAEDEEDVALSALNSFFGGVERKRFPALEDRDNLWSLLASITARKAINQRKRQLAAKRGGGMQLETSQSDIVARLVDDALTPAHIVAMSEQCRRLMQALADPKLEKIARLKLEGFTNEEIAQRDSVALRTVERKLNRIRHIWSEASGDD